MTRLESNNSLEEMRGFFPNGAWVTLMRDGGGEVQPRVWVPDPFKWSLPVLTFSGRVYGVMFAKPDGINPDISVLIEQLVSPGQVVNMTMWDDQDERSKRSKRSARSKR